MDRPGAIPGLFFYADFHRQVNPIWIPALKTQPWWTICWNGNFGVVAYQAKTVILFFRHPFDN